MSLEPLTVTASKLPNLRGTRCSIAPVYAFSGMKKSQGREKRRGAYIDQAVQHTWRRPVGLLEETAECHRRLRRVPLMCHAGGRERVQQTSGGHASLSLVIWTICNSDRRTWSHKQVLVDKLLTVKLTKSC